MFQVKSVLELPTLNVPTNNNNTFQNYVSLIFQLEIYFELYVPTENN